LKRVLQMDYKDPDAVRFHLARSTRNASAQTRLPWYLAVEGGEQYVPAHSHYAFMLAKQGKLAEAREHLQKLEPQSAPSVCNPAIEAQLMRKPRITRNRSIFSERHSTYSPTSRVALRYRAGGGENRSHRRCREQSGG
jgi:hypothetical protein